MEDHSERAQQEDWIRQSNLIYGGLIAIGIVLIQPFLTADSLDFAAKICVFAFAVAIPLLSALVLVNQLETSRRRPTSSILVAMTRPVAQLSAFTGVVAAFWHIHWVAGAGILSSGIVAVGVHSAGYAKLLRDTSPPASEDG